MPIKREKNYKPYKPDSVLFCMQNIAAIYLGVTLLQHSICLPASIGRAALNRLPIGHFITQGLPMCRLPVHIVRSYRTFSPLPLEAVIFCGASCNLIT